MTNNNPKYVYDCKAEMEIFHLLVFFGLKARTMGVESSKDGYVKHRNPLYNFSIKEKSLQSLAKNPRSEIVSKLCLF